MILYRWQGNAPNFGDELNTILWQRLLPGFFDDDPGARFLGIGSILDHRHAGPARKLVAGSGYGGYEAPPRLDHTWDISWVRGPRTARLLGLPATLGLGDPASLLPLAAPLPPRRRCGIGFMPHFESAGGGLWEQAAAAAGITLIDPRGDPRSIMTAIAGCETLLSEALHGVIVADALSVPWVAMEPLAPIHRPKWGDWADTLGLEITFAHLSPSSLLEHASLSRMAAYHAGRRLLACRGEWLRRRGTGYFVDRAAAALRRAAQAEPQLSARAALDRSTSRMLGRLDELRRGNRVKPIGS